MDNNNQIVYHNPIFLKAQENNIDTITRYFQQLWQLDNMIILIGAGFCKYIDGPLMSDLSMEILPKIIIDGIKSTKISTNSDLELNRWTSFWISSNNELKNELIKQKDLENISDELKSQLKDYAKQLNIEEIANLLKTIVDSYKILNIDNSIYQRACETIEKEIINKIRDITPKIEEDRFNKFYDKSLPYRSFLKRLIKYRGPQQPRVKIFSTNYDLLIETICDLEGIVCITGFEGKKLRIFNPTNYDLNISFKATGQSSVYYENVIHLYKLHGSVDWKKTKINGIEQIIQDDINNDGVVIYPCSTKYSGTLEMPYGEMFRRFGECLSQPQTVILTLGYGFMDEHINQMLLRAIKNPSCQIIGVEPKAGLEANTDESLAPFLKALIKEAYKKDEQSNPIGEPRICIIGGEAARFPEILNYIFPEVQLQNPQDEANQLFARLISLAEGIKK